MKTLIKIFNYIFILTHKKCRYCKHHYKKMCAKNIGAWEDTDYCTKWQSPHL